MLSFYGNQPHQLFEVTLQTGIVNIDKSKIYNKVHLNR